ncbi:hypothetical protein BC833DRAFT_620884 [Globomyces pollinis-pini]|nr:hypothetical protein BC833DRAFT_620884 [Globomyces pollinis-pini]
MPINQYFFQIILGTYDRSSALYLLRNDKDCLQLILNEVAKCWKLHIDTSKESMHIFDKAIRFPEPLTDINGEFKTVNVNLMPFVFTYDVTEMDLPPELIRYSDLIKECTMILDSSYEEICYLTVHESYVEPEKSQRRSGLHTESPGQFRIGGGEISTFRWGCGVASNAKTFEGGIIMASNVSNTCHVWNAQIQEINSTSVIGDLGDIEHLRSVLGPYISVPANRLVWITDLTPHESVPLKERAFRQYFRIVTKMDGWEQIFERRYKIQYVLNLCDCASHL